MYDHVVFGHVYIDGSHVDSGDAYTNVWPGEFLAAGAVVNANGTHSGTPVSRMQVSTVSLLLSWKAVVYSACIFAIGVLYYFVVWVLATSKEKLLLQMR